MKIAKVRDVKTPVRGTSKSAGIDFFVPNHFQEIDLLPGDDILIPSGIHVKPPEGYALIVKDKSGVASKKRLKVGACVIDEDYQGEVHLHVINVGSLTAKVSPGEKLVQMLLVPVSYEDVEVVDSVSLLYLKRTKRGEGGFGSTGGY